MRIEINNVVNVDDLLELKRILDKLGHPIDDRIVSILIDEEGEFTLIFPPGWAKQDKVKVTGRPNKLLGFKFEYRKFVDLKLDCEALRKRAEELATEVSTLLYPPGYERECAKKQLERKYYLKYVTPPTK